MPNLIHDNFTDLLLDEIKTQLGEFTDEEKKIMTIIDMVHVPDIYIYEDGPIINARRIHQMPLNHITVLNFLYN